MATKKSNFHFHALGIDGCFEIQPIIAKDNRGKFVKTFNIEDFSELGLEISFEESYYTSSKRNVFRGMHFQTPPMDHAKLVYCTEGIVLDFFLDLRRGSPTFGICENLVLSSEKANFIYLPRGIAHGFYVTSESATLVYNVTSIYSPGHDSGVLWKSVAIDWPFDNPIISHRDQTLTHLDNFITPFNYE